MFTIIRSTPPLPKLGIQIATREEFMDAAEANRHRLQYRLPGIAS
jgi:hypothetical protein